MIACPTLLVLRRVTTIYGGFGVLETSVSQGSIAVLSYLSFGGRSLRAAVCIAAVRVKRFQDRIDKNLLLLLSSDPRYFRYRGFKALIALSNYFGLDIPKGLGRLEKNMGNQFVRALDAKAFVFEQSYSLDHAAREVKRIIETYQNRRNGQ